MLKADISVEDKVIEKIVGHTWQTKSSRVHNRLVLCKYSICSYIPPLIIRAYKKKGKFWKKRINKILKIKEKSWQTLRKNKVWMDGKYTRWGEIKLLQKGGKKVTTSAFMN